MDFSGENPNMNTLGNLGKDKKQTDRKKKER